MSETTVDNLDTLTTMAAGDLLMVLDDLGAGSYQCKKVTFENLSKGTTFDTFQVDSDNSGPKLKNSSGEMQVRNAADDAYANLRAAVLALSGGQIVFPATQNPSANANTLDDYEEGTWTPGISFGGAVVGVTYDGAYVGGKYTKIGRMVFFIGSFLLTSKGASVGDAEITGLPFPSAANVTDRSVVSTYIRNITFANQFTSFVNYNSANIALHEITEGGAYTTLTNADFSDTAYVIVSGFYNI